MIHCIGDSHIAIFTGKSPDDLPPEWRIDGKQTINGDFHLYRIGSPTATGIYQYRSMIDKILETYVDKNKDKILFSFGEIDCRLHLTKMILEKKKDWSIINDSVDEYFRNIMYYNQLGYKTIIWGPIASFTNPEIKLGFYGNNIERNYITRKFNKYLELKCRENVVGYATLFYKMLNEDGTTKDCLKDNHLLETWYPIACEEIRKLE